MPEPREDGQANLSTCWSGPLPRARRVCAGQASRSSTCYCRRAGRLITKRSGSTRSPAIPRAFAGAPRLRSARVVRGSGLRTARSSSRLRRQRGRLLPSCSSRCRSSVGAESGYARRGMRDLCRRLLEQVPAVCLFVRADNLAAIRVYEAIGSCGDLVREPDLDETGGAGQTRRERVKRSRTRQRRPDSRRRADRGGAATGARARASAGRRRRRSLRRDRVPAHPETAELALGGHAQFLVVPERNDPDYGDLEGARWTNTVPGSTAAARASSFPEAASRGWISSVRAHRASSGARTAGAGRALCTALAATRVRGGGPRRTCSCSAHGHGRLRGAAAGGGG